MNFKLQAEQFLKTIETRKRRPAKPNTVKKYQSLLNTHILPTLGEKPIEQVGNGTLKTLISDLSKNGVSAQTLVSVSVVVKLVVASAVDDNGNPLFPRTWNNDFIDVPLIDPNSQKAPSVGPQCVSQAISRAAGEDRALYALLAGTGLRIGEALALRVGPEDSVNSTWNPQTGTIYVKQTKTQFGINDPKTAAGKREIDLASELNAYLINALTPVAGQPMFSPVAQVTGYRHLEKAGIPGYHSLRRFRVTYLRQNSVPEGLIKFWIGHAGTVSTDRYDKIRVDVGARKTFAEKAGLGFSL